MNVDLKLSSHFWKPKQGKLEDNDLYKVLHKTLRALIQAPIISDVHYMSLSFFYFVSR